jgi:hypothetical protein
MLIEKLNALRPLDQQSTQRTMNSLYTKNYRQGSQNQLMLRNSSRAQEQSRLTLRPRAEKENLNDMIVKRYSHLLNNN